MAVIPRVTRDLGQSAPRRAPKGTAAKEACFSTMLAIAATLKRQPHAEAEELLEIAELIDEVGTYRAAINPHADIDDAEVRCVLFQLLDAPTQTDWLRYRDFEVFPRFLTGLSDPSPMGLTIGELVYAYGLPDNICPPRAELSQVLRWSMTENLAI